MCYHYSLSKKPAAIKAEWEMPFEPVFHANGFAFPLMPVITQAAPDKVQAYRWGLIPHWTGSLADAEKLRAQTLNARAETIFTKPAFRSSVQYRCLILADGFFEWMTFQKSKYPHFVQLKDESVFAFAGLYSHWTDKESGELFRTYTLLTTDANPLLARIHNTKHRMPVVLPQALWQDWLQPELTQQQIAAQLHPLDDALMEGYPVSKRITNRGADTNVPEVRERVDYPELAFA